nr:hypothetical protein [Candidatus Sigynarchaeota archaeon]
MPCGAIQKLCRPPWLIPRETITIFYIEFAGSASVLVVIKAGCEASTGQSATGLPGRQRYRHA